MHTMPAESAPAQSLSEGELPMASPAGQLVSQGRGGWGSKASEKWPHDKWDRDEAPRRGATAPVGELLPSSPSSKRRQRGRGRRRSGSRLEMDRAQAQLGRLKPPVRGRKGQPPPLPAAAQPAEALGQHWQSPEEQLAAEVAAEWRMKAQSPLWMREMEGDVPVGGCNEALLVAAVSALEQAAPGGVHTALRFEEQLAQLDR